MPCGGIFPVEEHWSGRRAKPKDCICWYNDGDSAELFVEEWDTFLHARCFLRFITSEEGRCLLSHGHEIYIPLELKLEEEKK